MFKYKILFFIALSLAAFSCESDSSGVESAAASSTGIGGSLARFTIVGNFLYTIDNTTLTVFDLSVPSTPTSISAIPVGNGVETIFPLNDFLLMGTQNGLLIYRIMADGTPSFTSQYQHITSCDPVVANPEYAYVTLRASECREAAVGAANQLDVIDISNIEIPTLVNSFEMDEPRGLGLDGDVLFICEGASGLRVFSAADPINLVEINHLTDIHAVDVITLDGLLIVVGPERLVQLDYTDINDIKIVSEINILP